MHQCFINVQHQRLLSTVALLLRPDQVLALLCLSCGLFQHRMRGYLWLGLALRYLAHQRGKLCLLILVLFGCDLRRSALTAFMTGLMWLHGLLKTGRATVVQRLIDFRHFCGHAQTVDLTTGGAVLLSLV